MRLFILIWSLTRNEDVDLLPLNTVLVLLLDESDALEDVGDVVDPSLLLHVQGVSGLKI